MQHGNARLWAGIRGRSDPLETGQKLFCLDRSWGGETRPCRSGNCAPTSLTLRGAQMDLGPPVPFNPRVCGLFGAFDARVRARLGGAPAVGGVGGAEASAHCAALMGLGAAAWR